jgi:hypothetical protein
MLQSLEEKNHEILQFIAEMIHFHVINNNMIRSKWGLIFLKRYLMKIFQVVRLSYKMRTNCSFEMGFNIQDFKIQG